MLLPHPIMMIMSLAFVRFVLPLVSLTITIDALTIRMVDVTLFQQRHLHYDTTKVPQQIRNDNNMILSAVAYGRSDDSEWYQPPPPSSPPSTTYDNGVPINGVKGQNPVDRQNHRPSSTNIMVQQTIITSVQQFHDVFTSVSSSSASASESSVPMKHPSTQYNNHHPLMVVKFHASWCKSCQKVGYKIDHLISELRSSRNSQRPWHIVHVDYSTLSNRELFVQYNITQLPTIQVYYYEPERMGWYKGLDLPCPPHQFYKVRNWMVSYYQNDTKPSPKQKYDNENDDDDTTTTSTTSVLDFGHDVIESSVLPILRATTAAPIRQNKNAM